MFPKVTRREFIKTAAMSALAFSAFGVLPDEKVFAASDCAVKTRYGTFRGFLDQNGVKTWLGIPYAQSPVGNLRSCHGIDLTFAFNYPQKLVPNPSPNLIRQVQASLAAFAATGNPDNEYIPHWEKYSADNRQTMELNSKGCVCHKDLNTENLNGLRYIYEN